MADTGPAPAGSSSGGLRRYLLVRLALAPLFLFIILTVLFVLLRVAPGDPVTASLGGRASQADIERAREASGLNDPLLKQYFDYLSGVVRGDFGDPYTDPRSVTQIISDRFPATVELTMFAMVLAVTIGVLVGCPVGPQARRALRRRRPLLRRDHLRRAGVLAGHPRPAALRGEARLAPDRQPGVGRHPRRRPRHDRLLPDRRDHPLGLGVLRRRLRAPDPPGRDPRPGDQRRVHPHGPGEHAPDAALRLRRGGARPWRATSATSSTATPSATR